MNLKIMILTLLFTGEGLALFGQDSEQDSVKTKKPFHERLSFTGSGSVSHTEPAAFQVAPTISLDLNSFFQVGTGFQVQYSESGTKENSTANFNMGISAYGRFFPFKKLAYVQMEYEGINGKGDSLSWGADQRKFVSSALIGGGLKIPVGKKEHIEVTLLRNMSWKGATPVHPSPWAFRIGFSKNLSFNAEKDWISSMKERPFTPGMLPVAPILKKLGLEGNVSVSVGDPTIVDISPVFNLELNKKKTLSLGIGPSLQYSSKQEAEGAKTENINYGARIYTRYQPSSKWPYGQIEYEGLYGKGDSLSWGADTRKWVSAILIGGGYAINLPKVGSLNVTVLRDVTYAGVTPVRNNPWIFRTGLQAKLPFKDKPLPGTVAPKAAKLSKMADLFDLEGNLGLNIGEITRVDLSPAVSHTFKEKLSVGAGPIFQYYDDKKLDVNSATFGGRFFTRFKPKEHFPFFQVEAETLNGKEVSPLLKNAQNSERQWYSALMAGGGVNFPLGLKSSFNISALRNLTYQGPNPVRNSPWVIRAGLQL